MAYRKFEIPIIPGSLNLLAPGDKSADGDCLQITNWRVDQAGQLKQRYGWDVLNASTPAIYPNRVALVDSRRYFSGHTGAYGGIHQLGVTDPGGPSGEIDYNVYSVGPISIVSFQGLAWFMNNGAGGQRVDDGTYTWDWTPETPAIATLAASTPGGAALDAGTYEYYVTFQNTEGHEGNPSPVATVVVAAGGAVAVTRPARVANKSKHDNTTTPNITGWNVYRTGPGLGAIYRVNINVIPYATNPYNDWGAATGGTSVAQTNADLQDRAIEMETDHNAAPAAVGAIGTYDGRIIAFWTLANPNRMFWTDPNRPWYFPAANYVDVGALNDTIIGLSIKPNYILIYKRKSIWRHVGALGEGRLEQVSTECGLVGMNAIARTSQGDYFVGREGIYFFNGDSAKKISQKLDPLFGTETVAIMYNYSYDPIVNIAQCALGYRNGRLYFSYPTGAYTYPVRTAILHVETGRWVDWDDGFNDFYDEGQNGDLVAAHSAGIVKIDIGYNDEVAGVAYDLHFHSRYEDFGQPDKEKTFADLVIEHNTRGQSMTVFVVRNNGAAAGDQIALASINSAVKAKTIIRIVDGSDLPIVAFNLAVRLECTTDAAQTTPIQIFSIFLHAYIEASRAKTFDTDETSLGMQGVKEIQAIEIDGYIGGNTSMKLYSDYPGTTQGLLTAFGALSTYPFAGPTTGRVVLRTPVNQYTFGNLFRMTLKATSSYFQIYALRMLVRRIGVFIEAYETFLQGNWHCDDQDFGTKQIKAARELELDIDTSGNVTYTLTSDLPGNSMATRQTGTVNSEATTTRRRIIRVPLSSGIEGRHFALRLTAATKEVILFGARLEVKAFGAYIEAYEGTAGFVWDSDFLDMGIEGVKDFAELQIDVDTDGQVAVNTFTDLPGQAMANRHSEVIDTTATTTGRRMVNMPLDSQQGHYLQVKLSGSVAYRLYAIRARVRPYGHWIEASTAAGGAIYDSTEQTWGTPGPKEFDSAVLDIEASGTLTATFYTDLPGDAMAIRKTYTIPASSGRRTVTIPLDQIKGRLARLTIGGASAYKLYGGTVRLRPVAVYLNAANGESYRTREMDFGSESVKMFGEVEIDAEFNGTATVNVSTDLPGPMALRATFTPFNIYGIRQTFKLRLPPTAKGRLIRVEVLAGASAITIHAIRIYIKTMGGRAGSEWQWATVPMPTTPDTYTEVPLPVKATPDQWEWVDLPVAKTPVAWQWVPFPVPPTPNEFHWVEVPVES